METEKVYNEMSA